MQCQPHSTVPILWKCKDQSFACERSNAVIFCCPSKAGDGQKCRYAGCLKAF